jgi:rhamnulokinase
VIAGPAEATAAGNILVQAIGAGEVKSLAAARTIVRDSFEVVRYEPRPSSPWEAAYHRYQDIKSRRATVG